MDGKSLQVYMKVQKAYKGPIDGDLNSKESKEAIDKLSPLGLPAKGKKIVAVMQLALNSLGYSAGRVDGLIGPSTRFAIEQWQDGVRDVPGLQENASVVSKNWPTQDSVRNFYGPVGTSQVTLKLPYPMRLAWDTDKVVTSTSCHNKVVDSAHRVLTKVREIYGLTALTALGLDLFGGCLNVRKMRGGNSWSMHSWGIAFDFDPDHNQLRWGKDKARFAKKDYDKWWECWEEEGWVSLGRERNYDWMHVQAARL